MADDLSKRGAQDRSRINLNEPHEVRYWTNELGVDEETLRDTVGQFGSVAKDVRTALQNARKRRTH